MNIGQTIDIPWLLIGDFNETLLPSDQRGGIFHHNKAAIFSNLMNNCNLLDLTTTGGCFTWHRNNNGIRISQKNLIEALQILIGVFPFLKLLLKFSADSILIITLSSSVLVASL